VVNPVWFIPIGGALAPAKAAVSAIPRFGRYAAYGFKVIEGLTKVMTWPLTKPASLAFNFVFKRAPKVRLVEVPVERPLQEITDEVSNALLKRMEAGEALPVGCAASEAGIKRYLATMPETMLRDWHTLFLDVPKPSTGMVEVVGGKTIIPDVPSAEEYLAYIRAHHPGRLGESRLGPQVYPKLTLAEEWESTIKGAYLVKTNASEIGVTMADFVVSRLDDIVDIYKVLGYDASRGTFTRGVRALEGAPKVGGKASYAVRDVLEHFGFYEFKDPRVLQWIKVADDAIDKATKLALSHGIDIDRTIYYELSHYFPSKVIGLKDVAKAASVGPGAGRLSVKIWAMRHRVFEFMQQGLEAGFIYAGPKDALRFFLQGIYRMIGNKQALELLEPFLKPLAKETEVGAAAIARAEAARLAARRAENLGRLLQRIRRGETPHPSTMRWLERVYPDLAPRIKEVLAMPEGAGKAAAIKELIGEAKLLTGEAKMVAAEALKERVSVVEMLSRREFTGGMVNQPALRNRIFADITVNGKRVTGQEVAARIDAVFSEKVPAWLNLVAQTARGLVTLEAALDTSAPFIQGIWTFGYDVSRWLVGDPSFIWGKTAATHVAIMLDPRILRGFRRANIRVYERYLPLGLRTASDPTEFYAGLGFIGKTVGRIPVAGDIFKFAYGRTGLGFSAWGEMARIELIKSMERAWLAGGGSRMELVECVHMLTGTISTRTMGLGATQRAVESATLFASNYLRSNLLVLGNLFTRGMTGHMIRRSVGGAAIGLPLAYASVCSILGQPIKLNPAPRRYQNQGIFEGLPDFLQPWGAEAFTIKIGGHNIGLPGFAFGFAKMFAGLIMLAIENPEAVYRIDIEEFRRNHPALQWLWGKSSPLVGLVREMVTGRDFLGNRFQDVGDYAESVYSNFLSIALQSILVQDPPASLLAFGMELMGWRTFPQSAWGRFYDRADEIIATILESELSEAQLDLRAKGTLGWNDLDPLQKKKLLDQYPDLAELQAKAGDASALRASDDWVRWDAEKARYTENRDADDVASWQKLLDSGQDFNIVDFRKALVSNADTYFNSMRDLETRFPGVYAEFAKYAPGEDVTAFEQAYNEWYDWVLYGPGTQDELGNPIWSVIDARKREWMEKWGQEYLDGIMELQEVRYSGRLPILWKRREDSYALDEYWAISDENGDPDKAARLAYRADPNNLENEARLIFWGYTSTIENPEAEAIVKQWCQEYGIDIRDIPAFAKLMISEADMAKYGIQDPNILREYSQLLTEGWEQERFLQENPEFYRYWVEVLGHKEIDFSKVPSVEIERLWNDYQEAELGDDRLRIRCQVPEFDAWLVNAKGYTPAYGTDRCETFTSQGT